MLNLRFITLAIVVLAALSHGQSSIDSSSDSNSQSNEGPYQMSEIEAKSFTNFLATSNNILNAALNSTRNAVRVITENVTAGFQTVLDSGNSFISRMISSMTNRQEEVNQEITLLHEQHSDPKYSKCFPTSPISTALNQSVVGVSTCINDIIDKAQSTLNSLTYNIGTIYTTLAVAQNTDACKGAYMGEWLCQQYENTKNIASLGAAVTNLTVTSTGAIAYFSNVPTTFLPCAAYEAKFHTLAYNTLRNVTTCISDVMNKE